MATVLPLGPACVHFGGVTDVGRVRSGNEDAFLIARDLPLCIVADGMGGHASGEVASRIAVDSIAAHFIASEADEPPTWPFRPQHGDIVAARMATAVKLANIRIFEAANNDPACKGMGCTLETLFFSRGYYFVGHVGDSRVYRWRRGRLEQLTADHSLLNDYRHMRDMSPEEIASFPHKNVVVRALGLADSVKVDVVSDVYEVGDLFMLCSDGLTDMIEDREVHAIIEDHLEAGVERISAELVDAANRAGGKDNITAVVARIETP
jgi:protein phosphatase